MGLSHEHVGPKILAKIKIYVLTRAELLISLCYEIPCITFNGNIAGLSCKLAITYIGTYIVRIKQPFQWKLFVSIKNQMEIENLPKMRLLVFFIAPVADR